VNAAGQFTGQWLFDAVIVTTQDIDGKDIMDTSLTGANLTDLLSQEFADAAAALAQQYGAPGPSACATLTLPAGAQVTGVRATLAGGHPASDWYMVSELSTQLPGGGRTRLTAPTRNTIST
jgi:hypothetical protein